jgi:hypothetical protein
MIVRRLFSVLALLCAGAALSMAAAAQPAPGPSPTPTPIPGLIGAGTLTIKTQMLNPPSAGASPTAAPAPPPPMTITANIAFEVTSRKVRIDLPSIALSGLSPAMAGMAPSFPAGGVTVVADYSTWKMIVWVPSTKKYFVGDIPKPAFGKAATSQATAMPTAMPMPPVDPFTAFSMFKGVKTFSIALTGHSTANGHPTSQYDLAFEQENAAGNTFSLHGQVQLADDLSELPVVFAMSAKGTKMPESSLRYDVTSLARQLPPESDFHPPSGYKRATNPGDAFKI